MRIEVGDKIIGTVKHDYKCSPNERYIVIEFPGCCPTTARVLESTE